MNNYDYIENFKSTIANARIEPPREITPDGELHRFISNVKSGDKAGYYTFFTNPDGTFGGSFGCWREGIKGTWSSSSTNKPAAFSSAQMEILRQAEALKRLQMNSERAGYAQHLYSEATDIPLEPPLYRSQEH
ncbi:hypothetical protein [Photobacterium sp. OFAV2-7]|uniref:hypothetical protein n=1 Tax=Photobacterium sp. OFAV2-7 TaxID=2917748 RepID=UPI001EF6EF22|nr:hypothetical protein [Photobacterium sp. OFAV2-7]MCG7587148.1 hypothetical protein [Photobacterium sp. OFAV2-7]